jgi:uncharacterized protein YidB (DUF937 family)
MTEPPRRPAGQWTPAELGVHPVIGGGPMPGYFRRPHDERLRAALNPAIEDSRLVVIRGDALTGTSRAGYEAVIEQLADWSLEYLPTAAELAARLAAEIPARTVLWLGELLHYVEVDGGAALLSRLDGLLEEDGYVVITTIWPGYWDSYAAAAAAGLGAADPAAVAGQLLARLDESYEYQPDTYNPALGVVVDVPDRFTPAELTAAAETGDPALAAAAAAVRPAAVRPGATGPGGQVIQHLAGVRDLLARYDGPGADPGGQAIITAAMDASRLGHAGPLPAALLRDAAVGYLADAQRAGWADRWDAALAWATDVGWALQTVPPAAGDGTVGYRVPGYLDQHGRRIRADQLGPASLWDGLAAHVSSTSDLGRLAQAARDRGLYRHAAGLWTVAAAAGQADAASQLVTHLSALAVPADLARAARWAVGRASLDDPWDVARLVVALRTAGADEAVQVLLDRDPAGQVSLEHRWDVAWLLRELRTAGAAGAAGAARATEAARALVVRIAPRASLGDPRYTTWLLRALHATGAVEALQALASRAVDRADLENMWEVAPLLASLHEVGAAGPGQTLAARAAEAVDVEDPHEVAQLLGALRGVGADDSVRALLARDPARHASLDRTYSVAELLEALHAAGAGEAVLALAARAAPQVSLEDAEYAARLLRALGAAHADDAIQVLLARDPAGQAQLMFPEDLGQLLDALRAAGAEDAARALVARIADPAVEYYLWDTALLTALRAAGAQDTVRVLAAGVAEQMPIDHPGSIADLLQELRDAGTAEAIQALLARDPAGQASLDDLWDVASLLDALSESGAGDAVAVLAARAAQGVSLDDPGTVARLLEALRAAGADDAARILAARAARGASLDDPQGVARLLEALRAAGAGDAVQALLARDPGSQLAIDASQPFRPGYQRAVARLLAALREVGATAAGATEAGATEAVRILAARAADAGMFGLLLEVHPDQAAHYRFGREPDGTGSPQWPWSEPAPA